MVHVPIRDTGVPSQFSNVILLNLIVGYLSGLLMLYSNLLCLERLLFRLLFCNRRL